LGDLAINLMACGFNNKDSIPMIEKIVDDLPEFDKTYEYYFNLS
jgi:hypothetical protein